MKNVKKKKNLKKIIKKGKKNLFEPVESPKFLDQIGLLNQLHWSTLGMSLI